jgi:hypothetical protein
MKDFKALIDQTIHMCYESDKDVLNSFVITKLEETNAVSADEDDNSKIYVATVTWQKIIGIFNTPSIQLTEKTLTNLLTGKTKCPFMRAFYLISETNKTNN